MNRSGEVTEHMSRLDANVHHHQINVCSHSVMSTFATVIESQASSPSFTRCLFCKL